MKNAQTLQSCAHERMEALNEFPRNRNAMGTAFTAHPYSRISRLLSYVGNTRRTDGLHVDRCRLYRTFQTFLRGMGRCRQTCQTPECPRDSRNHFPAYTHKTVLLNRSGKRICKGVEIYVTDIESAPLSLTQFYVMEELAAMYPAHKAFAAVTQQRLNMFDKVCGSKEIRKLFSRKAEHGVGLNVAPFIVRNGASMGYARIGLVQHPMPHEINTVN